MSQERLQRYHAEIILYSGYWEFHGVQLLGCGANHPLPSSARLQMGWSYISSYCLCWHGVTSTFTVPKVMHFCSRWCWTWLGIQWRPTASPHPQEFKSNLVLVKWYWLWSLISRDPYSLTANYVMTLAVQTFAVKFFASYVPRSRQTCR